MLPRPILESDTHWKLADIIRLFASRPGALRYVLLSGHKHFWRCFGRKPPPEIDCASSGRHFEGWKLRGRIDPAAIPGI